VNKKYDRNRNARFKTQTSLLNEKQIKRNFSLYGIAKYRIASLIKPVGYALSSAGVSPFYNLRQINALKAKLQKIAASKSKQ